MSTETKFDHVADPALDLDEKQRIAGYPIALFEWAVLHIVVAVANRRYRLLFAEVELLPREIPPPLHGGVISGPHLRASGWRIFADHIPLPVERAIAWYEDVRRGTVVRPQPDGSLPVPDASDAVLCESNRWIEEPVWPAWVTPAPPRVLPFVLPWHRTPRLHHLIATAPVWDFLPTESAQLDDFLEQEAGFRRSEWEQLAGSVHLLVPNPYYRDLKETLGDPIPEEAVTITLEPRIGVTMPALRVELAEHRPTGIGRMASVLLDSEPVTVPLARTVHETSAIVRLASSHDIVEVVEKAPFMRQIAIEMNTVASKRVVHVRDANGLIQEIYEVNVDQPFSRSEMPHPAGAAFVLDTMLKERSVRAAASQLEQQWVVKDPAAAMKYVRSRVQRAREQVLIADPWLSGMEVQRYALAVSLKNVPVRLLTTGDGFKSYPPDVLETNIRQWRIKDPSLGKIEVRVMSRNELHDRFLRVDDRLYTLGNSLNALGQRGSLMMRIPNPTPLFHALEEIWCGAKSLADYIVEWRRPAGAA